MSANGEKWPKHDVPPVWPADMSWNAFQQMLKWWRMGTAILAERQAALVILHSVYPFHSELAVQLEEADETYYTHCDSI